MAVREGHTRGPKVGGCVVGGRGRTYLHSGPEQKERSLGSLGGRTFMLAPGVAPGTWVPAEVPLRRGAKPSCEVWHRSHRASHQI